MAFRSILRSESISFSLFTSLRRRIHHGFKFWTKDGIAVILRPDTEEQREQSHWMERMWKINHLGNCGPVFAVEFAQEHGIKYSYQVVV